MPNKLPQPPHYIGHARSRYSLANQRPYICAFKNLACCQYLINLMATLNASGQSRLTTPLEEQCQRYFVESQFFLALLQMSCVFPR